MFKQITVNAFIVALCIMLHSAQAQRPSYAGSRPQDGLNQRDKYHQTFDNGTHIVNRFGTPDNTVTNQLAFGQPQRPPMEGVALVRPESTYVPLPVNNNNIELSNRFGDVGNTNSVSSSSASSSASAGSGVPSRLPFDAHGDRELVNQLNRLPIDKRPFWFINYEAIEAQRNGSSRNFAGAVPAPISSFFG